MYAEMPGHERNTLIRSGALSVNPYRRLLDGPLRPIRSWLLVVKATTQLCLGVLIVPIMPVVTDKQ